MVLLPVLPLGEAGGIGVLLITAAALLLLLLEDAGSLRGERDFTSAPLDAVGESAEV